ncbi:uncharacterized protein [Dermacentor andersoni]|uniref:uncharacterized protein isoform X1 n=2 Tax=Dermacentor andersoni TaxID=34620 RepID=UPI003B3BE060
MPKLIVFKVFAVLHAVVALQSNAARSALVESDATPSIKEFVDVEEPIWTRISTENATVLCKVDVRVRSQDDSIQFNRSFYMGYHNWTTYTCNGAFYQRSQQNMRVTETGRGDYIEKLLYTGANQTCGVLVVKPVTSGSTEWYELRIRNSSITRRTDRTCTEHLKKVAGSQRNRTMFRRHCLHMLKIGNATYSRWELQ